MGEVVVKHLVQVSGAAGGVVALVPDPLDVYPCFCQEDAAPIPGFRAVRRRLLRMAFDMDTSLCL